MYVVIDLPSYVKQYTSRGKHSSRYYPTGTAPTASSAELAKSKPSRPAVTPQLWNDDAGGQWRNITSFWKTSYTLKDRKKDYALLGVPKIIVTAGKNKLRGTALCTTSTTGKSGIYEG